MEHRDITPVKRPEHPGQKTYERVKTYLFFDLIKEALANYDDAKSGKLEMPKQGLRPNDFDLEFFFKKSWDKFTEPLLEYDDLLAAIEKRDWESNGAKSRAINALKERLKKTVAAAREALPEFDRLSPNSKERKQALARTYEGYASYVKAHERKLTEAFGMDNESGRRHPHFLRTYLGVLKPRPGTTGEVDVDW